jgi:hypothetical protein
MCAPAGGMELSCESHSGSVTHFYHFFFSCLVPLIYFRSTHPLDSLSFVTPIGPFRPILEELSLDLSYDSHENYQKILLPSYDVYDNQFYRHPTEKYPSVPDHVRKAVITYLDNLSFRTASLHHYPSSLKIILIERDHNPISSSFSAFSRRNIRNHHQLKRQLRQNYSSTQFQNIYLERMPFLAQYQLFRRSSIVIAQHGAALSNIFFMKSLSDSCQSQSHVIEISPPYSRKAQYFYNLADSLSVSYSSIYQERNRGNVSVTEVSAHLDCILSSWKKEKKNQCNRDPHYLGRLCGDIVGNIGNSLRSSDGS